MIPPAFRKDVDALPPLIRELLDAELAAGNEILSVSHAFPAPPIGAALIMTRPITTRPRASGEGFKFREGNSSLYHGSFTDRDGRFFLLEAPMPPPAMPDMDAIREASNAPRPHAVITSGSTLVDEFRASMQVDYEKWHDGIGYNVDLLERATDAERAWIEGFLVPPSGWRDVEALATARLAPSPN